jgi:hypothetical protein
VLSKWRLALALAVLAGLVYWHDRAERARIAALTDEIAALRRPSAPVLMPGGAPARVLDSAAIEAVAERVAALVRLPAAASATRAPPAPSAAEPPAPPTPQQLAAAASAHRLVDAAVARGRLSPDDVLAIRQQLTAAQNPELTMEVRSAIAVAVNKQQLKPEDPHFLYP